jgi:hypothetical protein
MRCSWRHPVRCDNSCEAPQLSAVLGRRRNRIGVEGVKEVEDT